MAGLIRAHDWAATPLGPSAGWPESLKALLRTMLSTPQAMCLVWGPELTFFYNDGYAPILGLRHPDALGRPMAEVWADVWPEIAPLVDQAMSGQAVALTDLPLTMTRKGYVEETWWSFTYSPVHDDAGAVAGMINICTDATAQLMSDQKRAASAERLEMALSAGDGVGTWDWDVPEDRVYADERFARIYGVDPDMAHRGAPIVEFFGAMHPDDLPRVQGEIAQALATGDTFSSEYRLIQPDGEIRWVAAQGRASLSPDGRPLRFPGVTFDITERRRMADAVAESEARYRTLFDSIDEGFCIIEMLFDERGRPFDYRFIESNPAFERQTGLTQAIGRTMLDFAPDMEQHWFDSYGRVAMTGEPSRFVNRAEALSRWYDVYAFRIGEPEQRRVAVLFNDITKAKQADLRQRVLLELTNAIRDLTDPAEIAHASSGILAEALSVSRVGYGVMDTQAETITIERDYNAAGVHSLAGVIHFRDFGDYIEDLARGEAVIFADAAQDPRVGDGGAALAGISATALINLPLIEQGKVVALLFVNNAVPRVWSEADVALVREVAELVRTATERARATVAVRENEARLRFLDDLNVEVAKLTEADAILAVTTRLTARHLGVDNCAYADMDADQDGFTIRGDWAAPGLASIVGHYQLADFGTLAVQELGAGRPLILNDNRKELPPEEAAAYQALGISATICMPLVKAGRLTALMAIHHREPHVWTDEELATIREVTERSWAHVERVRADAARTLSQGRYRALFDAIDEGFCIIEFVDGPEGPLSDYVHVEANAAYAENAGIPDVVGQRVRDMVGDEAQSWIDLYKGVLETGTPIRFEKELEETARWLELAAFRIEPRERHQVAVLFKDLTAKKLAERALVESEERLRLAMEAGGQGAWELDLVTLELAASEHCKRNFGRDPGAPFTYEDLQDSIHPEDLGRMQAAVVEAIKTGQTYDIEYRIIRGDQEGWVQVKGQPFYADDGSPRRMIGVSSDISTRKKAEQTLARMNEVLEERVEERTHELQAAHEALRQSQKMEAVGQLTGGIAHDFNNLLAGISGSLELLSKRLTEGRLNGMERYIDAAQGSAQRAAALTQRLLAFSRRQTLDPKPTDVNRLINGMEDLIRRSVGPDVELEVVGAGGLWATKVDQPQLENALLNLCINARDAMAPDGGRLTIETSNKWLDERASRDRELPPGQYVSLCVTDTGTGMTPDIQAQVFDPFFTTKPLGQGTGLGLSMIHGFVRQSGGQVRIYSEVGKGTTMCLYLPRHLGEVEAGEDQADIPVAPGGHGETVLVVDDEATVRMLVAEVLGEAGYHVIEAPDGPSGLEILRSGQRVDLLISDVGLPGGMNGRQVADAARETRPDLKVLFITGYAENAAVGNGLLGPGMEVITKPFVMADLALKVTEMIDS